MLTISLGTLSYSWIQIRISEALTLLPVLYGFPAVVGLTLGCIISNFFSPVGIFDIIFGPFLTFLAAFLTWRYNFDNIIIAALYPILVNSIGVSIYLSSFYNIPYFLSVISIAVSEFIATMLIGIPLVKILKKRKYDQLFKK